MHLPKTILIGSLFLLVPFHSAYSQESTEMEKEEEKVLKVVQDLFDAMEQANPQKMKSLLLTDGFIYSMRVVNGDSVDTNSSSFDEFASNFGNHEAGVLKERMWNPEVLIEGRIAMVWAPYDFHANGQFSHCGIDLFSFLKTSDGWKVNSISYTAQRNNCEESPLGPLDEGE